MTTILPESAKVTTALLLAAGTGSRLQPLTNEAPKCLTEVDGTPILERLVKSLISKGVNRLIVVLGHLDYQIKDFLQPYTTDLQIDYVTNPDYKTTNNIYSLWFARDLIKEPFLLVESDLVFEANVLDDMLIPDRMAVSSMLPWMNGTTVELADDLKVTTFRMGDEDRDDAAQYKTVNLYSFSMQSWKTIDDRLSDYVSHNRLGEYYEAVFAALVADGLLETHGVLFDKDRWYEIDTVEDLKQAEEMLSRLK